VTGSHRPATTLAFVLRLPAPAAHLTSATGAIGATPEALIAAFCRLEKSLSHSEQMGWLVGAVGIELSIKFTKSYVVTVLPTADPMNWSQLELNPHDLQLREICSQLFSVRIPVIRALSASDLVN
jgi:hypothetical protein